MLKEANFHLFKDQFFFFFIFYYLSLLPFVPFPILPSVSSVTLLSSRKFERQIFLCNTSTVFSNLIFSLLSASSAPFYFLPRVAEGGYYSDIYAQVRDLNVPYQQNKFALRVHFTLQTDECKIVDLVRLIRFGLNILIMKRRLNLKRTVAIE
jgi:hypothetical protein